MVVVQVENDQSCGMASMHRCCASPEPEAVLITMIFRDASWPGLLSRDVGSPCVLAPLESDCAESAVIVARLL